MSNSLPRVALVVLAVGLALHNLVMSGLWDAGLRGAGLDVVAAWKEVLLAVALASVLWRTKPLPLSRGADRLALAYTTVVVLYAILPQDWLGGEATGRGILLALRHDLVPVAAYAFGRCIVLAAREGPRLAVTLVATAAGVAAFGVSDAYLIPLQWWRDSGVPGWYREQLGLDYRGLSGLPENWVYNTGDETNPIRRLTSTFLSPLASAYMLVVVLLLLAMRPRSRWTMLASALVYAGLLFTHTRAAYLALAFGLVVLAAARRRWWPVLAAAVSLAVSVAFVQLYSEIGPSTSYTRSELAYLREYASRNPGTSADPLSARESSASSHLRNLRDGLETVLRHPQGYGLGNAGTAAKRTGVELRAGESTYTELGVETGIAGLALFVAWLLAVFRGIWSRSAWLTAAFAAVLVVGLQTDVLGVPWLAYVVFALAGAAQTRPVALES